MAPNDVSAPQQLQSFNRVAELPLVKSALALATDQYEKIKGYNAVVGNGLVKAEQTVQFVAESAKPVVSKLERQLSFADNIVCQGLDKLEEKVPAIKKSPDELKTAGWEKVGEIKSYGYERVNQALASQYAIAVMKSVDTAMDLTETAVDHYLPATEGEPTPTVNGKDEQNVVQRMGRLSDKMRLRMYHQALHQIQYLQKRSENAIDTMRHSVDLISYAKSIEENGRRRLSGSVENVQQRAKWLWDELNKDEAQSQDEQAVSGVEQQLLVLARRATREVINRYNQLGDMSHLFPENVQQSVQKSTDYAKDVYTQLSSASSLKDVSDIAMKQLSSAMESVQQLIANTSEQPAETAQN